jgi:hypothetical protein
MPVADVEGGFGFSSAEHKEWAELQVTAMMTHRSFIRPEYTTLQIDQGVDAL